MEAWGQLTQAAVGNCYRTLQRDYIDPPLPVQLTIQEAFHERFVQLRFHFADVEPHSVEIRSDALFLNDSANRSIGSYRRFATENIATYIIDTFQDWDHFLLSRAFANYANSIANGRIFFQIGQCRDQLLQEITRHYQLAARDPRTTRPFFSLRDVEREYCLWVADPNSPNPTQPPPQLERPEANPHLVTARMEALQALIQRVLAFQENPYVFRDRQEQLNAVDRAKEDARIRERMRIDGIRDMQRFIETVQESMPALMGYDIAQGVDYTTTATEIRTRMRERDRSLFQQPQYRPESWRDYYLGNFDWEYSSGRSEEAEARGLKLLEENLNKQQLASWRKKKSFLVIGGQSGDQYEIRSGYQRNVFRIEKSGKRKGLCFLPAGNLCIGDTLLAQKIGIELHEEEILRVAIPFSV